MTVAAANAGMTDALPECVDSGYAAVTGVFREVVSDAQWEELTGGERYPDVPADGVELSDEQLEQLAEMTIPKAVLDRVEELGEAVSTRGVTRAERSEVWGHVLGENFVAILKLDAMARLGRTPVEG